MRPDGGTVDSAGRIRIVIADDHPVVRLGLRTCLSAEPDLVVIAEACDGREAIARVREGGLDVLMLDIGMPVLSGPDALGAIRRRAPDLPVLVFSGSPARHHAVALMREGASGYLDKGCSTDEIVQAVRAVHRGRHYVGAAAAEELVEALDRHRERAPHEQLSRRELQVFLHLARGDTVGGMAERLSLSAKTVSTYRTRVMEKMALASNSELTYYALKAGLMQ
jgi:DNA-binding NarL/FixJ family response regulator